MKKSKSVFKSRWGFILASVGSAVGMANVWGFPSKLGSNGGGAFLVAYIIFIFIFSYVGLSAEFAIGRRARTGTLGSYEEAWKNKGKNQRKFGKAISWIPLLGSLTLAMGYAIIVSYVFKALIDSISGTLLTTDTNVWFESFSLKSFSVVPYHIVIIIIVMLTLFFGVKSIEKTNTIMMPIFFLIFVVLAIRVFFLDNSIEGYMFMLIPRWEYLKDPMVWIWAMGQAFFSLSITGSGMIVYGSYLDDKEDVIAVSRNTAIFDTIAAIISAFVIIPACFSYGVPVQSGPGLLFVTIPNILKDIYMGEVFAVLLYVAMIFAGISSLQNMLEVVCESLMFKFKNLKRKNVLMILGVLCLSVGIFIEPIYKWGPWMDFICIYIIPLGATIGAISWFWIMKKEDMIFEINKGVKEKINKAWYLIGKYVYVPLALVLFIVAVVMKIPF
ncbi:MAG: sodium-dependent transporter [Anaerorhabdus sp.]